MTTSEREAAAASRLMEMTIDHWRGELLLQAAEMSLADKFDGDSPRSAKELAAEYGMRHRELYRYLRALTGIGVLAFAGKDSFRLTDLGAALRTGAPGSARSAVIALIGDMVKPAWKDFDHGLLTPDPGFEKAHGMSLFEYLQKNPGMATFFSETMVGFHGREPPAVAEAYDFSGIGSLVGVGACTTEGTDDGSAIGVPSASTGIAQVSANSRRTCSSTGRSRSKLASSGPALLRNIQRTPSTTTPPGTGSATSTRETPSATISIDASAGNVSSNAASTASSNWRASSTAAPSRRGSTTCVS